MDAYQKTQLGRAALVAVALAIGLALILRIIGVGGGEEAGERPLTAPIQVKAVEDETHLTLGSENIGAAGIEIAGLKPVTYQDRASALATVVLPQTLAEQQRSLLAAAGDVTRAELAVNAARLEVKRLQPLHRDGRIVSDKALEVAQATLAGEEANLKTASSQLRAEQTATNQQWGTSIGRWLSGGSPELDGLLDGRDVLLLLTTPIAFARTDPSGGEVEVRQGVPEAVKVLSGAPQADPKFQGRSFYAVAPSQPDLRPGMTFSGAVLAGAPSTGVFVPESAIVRWQGRAWVYVLVADREAVRRPVATDAAMPDGWFARSGLAAGTRIVVQGAQLLLSEEIKSRSPNEAAK